MNMISRKFFTSSSLHGSGMIKQLSKKNYYNTCYSSSIPVYHSFSIMTFSTTKTKEEDITITASKVQEDDKEQKSKVNIDITKFTKEITIKLPDLVDVGQRAKISKWYKQPGDIIDPDETICDVETDMFTFGMDVDDECIGVMKEILLQENEETKESQVPICIILHEDDEVDNVKKE